MLSSKWDVKRILLVSITLYVIVVLLALVVRVISNHTRRFRKTGVYFVEDGTETFHCSRRSLIATTAIRLIICWIFAFSVAFVTFARLQCGSALDLPPHWCSAILQFLILCEMQMLVAEQLHHHCCITGVNCRMIVLKFLVFSICLPATATALLYHFLGKDAFDPMLESSASTTMNKSSPRGELAGKKLGDVIFSETCWLKWGMLSLKITSWVAVFSVFVCTVMTLINVVTLLRLESKGVQVSYKSWWGIAVRFVFPVITAAKWASITFESSCFVNFYNVLAAIFVSPILMIIMFAGPARCEMRNSVSSSKHLPGVQRDVTLDVVELNEIKETDPMMLHDDVLHSDVTRHMARDIYPNSKYPGENGMDLRQNGVGETSYSQSYNGGSVSDKYYAKNKGRNSSDVDDGVISNDGDYDPSRQNMDTLEVEQAPASASGYSKNTERPVIRLSHAESTDSGMGFSDNLKDGENSRLSAGDGYGTIHMIKPSQEQPTQRKSLIDGDAEYDEVMEFITTPTEEQDQSFSDISTPKKSSDVGGSASPGESNSKYAELDLAKILHTRRRHRHTSTLVRRPTEEEKPADESMFNSLKRKPKSKNYSFSAYATYGRNRKSSRQQNTDSWASRPSSAAGENDDTLSPLSDSGRTMGFSSFERPSKNYSSLDIPPVQTHSQTLDPRRTNYTNDLMMTSDVNDDVMLSSATLDRRTSWRTRPKSPPVDVDGILNEITHGSNRWSWLSNSSSQGHYHGGDKSPSKSPWKIFRRLLGGDSKHKHGNSTSMSAVNLSSSRPKSTSIFRRFSSKKRSSKRRNSVPAKSEWDVHMVDYQEMDISTHVPVIDAAKQKPVAPKALTQKSRGRLSSRLMSFRGGKNKNLKRGSDPMSKGLSISSPQLALNAVDPTRNYSERQLVDLNKMSLNS